MNVGRRPSSTNSCTIATGLAFVSHCGRPRLVGIIHPILGKYDQAVDEAKKSIELDPDLATAYHILAVRHQNLDRLGEADNTLDRPRKVN